MLWTVRCGPSPELEWDINQEKGQSTQTPAWTWAVRNTQTALPCCERLTPPSSALPAPSPHCSVELPFTSSEAPRPPSLLPLAFLSHITVGRKSLSFYL